MKKKDLSKYREKKLATLIKDVDRKKIDLVSEKTKLDAGKSKNPKKMRSIKKNVAQIMTIIRERQIIDEESTVNKKPRTTDDTDSKEITRKRSVKSKK